jgi:hypothetical protein
MTRIKGIASEETNGYIKDVYHNQIQKYGKVLENHKLYARRPTIFKAVRGMWEGIDQSGLISEELKTMLNIRVASMNGCPF